MLSDVGVGRRRSSDKLLKVQSVVKRLHCGLNKRILGNSSKSEES